MPSIASTYTITASESAAFAVSSRLISCLVTEGLLRAFYVPLPHNHPTSTEGAIIVLAPGRSSDQSARLHTDEIFAIVHVHHAPVLAKGPKHKHGFPVALVDPLDMLPEIYDVIDSIDHVEPPEQVSFTMTVEFYGTQRCFYRVSNVSSWGFSLALPPCQPKLWYASRTRASCGKNSPPTSSCKRPSVLRSRRSS